MHDADEILQLLDVDVGSTIREDVNIPTKQSTFRGLEGKSNNCLFTPTNSNRLNSIRKRFRNCTMALTDYPM